MSAPINDTMPKIIRKIPSDCLEPDLKTSMFYFLRDVCLAIFFVFAIVYFHSWIFGPILALGLGFVLTGFFVIGHDAAHRSFSKSERINNIIGHLTLTLTYWPFHVWRLSHDIHHRNTHNIDKDIAWVPFTHQKYSSWPKALQQMYLQTRSNLFFIGSIFFTMYFIKDARRGSKSTHFKQSDMPQVNFSLIVMYVWLAVSISVAAYYFGVYGIVCLIVLPQLGFQFWLSTFTLFHHTHEDVTFMPQESWTMEKAQLGSTIHVDYPYLVEWFCHDINWHVPHHVCVGIPHYKLRKAHVALKACYPDIVREEKISWELAKKVINQCHFITSKTPADMTWISKNAAERSDLQVTH